MKSKFLTINWKDLSRSILMTILTTILGMLSTSITNQQFPTTEDFLNMLKIGALSGAVYLIKNLFTNSQDKILRNE
jgi:hypothetical protein